LQEIFHIKLLEYNKASYNITPSSGD